MTDLMSNVKVVNVIKPHSPSATGTITGTVVDTANFSGNTFVLHAGLQTTTGVTAVPVILSGSATGSLTSEADANLIGTEAEANLSGTAGASSCTKIGYIGSNRYVRCDLTVAVAATGTYGVNLTQSGARKGPQGQS